MATIKLKKPTGGAPAAPAAPHRPPLRGTGDLGVVIERARGSVQIVEQSARRSLGRVDGLGDLSHASVVFSRDGRYAFVFGRDGGLTKIDMLEARMVKRVIVKLGINTNKDLLEWLKFAQSETTGAVSDLADRIAAALTGDHTAQG